MSGSIKISESNHGKPILLFNGYVYLFKDFGAKKRIWYCDHKRRHKCKSRLHTSMSLQDPKLILELGTHNHRPDAIAAELRTFRAQMKRDAKTTSDEPASIIARSLMKMSEAAQGALRLKENPKFLTEFKTRKPHQSDAEGVDVNILMGNLLNAATASSTSSPTVRVGEQVSSVSEAPQWTLPLIQNIKRTIKNVRKGNQDALAGSQHTETNIDTPVAVQVTEDYDTAEVNDQDGGPETDFNCMEILEKRCLICRTSSGTTSLTKSKTNQTKQRNKSTKSSKLKTTSIEEKKNENTEDDSSGFKMFKLYKKLVQVLDPNLPNRLPDTEFLPSEFEYVCSICAKSIYAVWEYQQKLERITSQMDSVIKNIKTAIRLQSNEGLINCTFSDNYEEANLINDPIPEEEEAVNFAMFKEEPISVSVNGDNSDYEDIDFPSFPVILPSRPTRKRKRNRDAIKNSSLNPNLLSEDSSDVIDEGTTAQETRADINGDSDSDFNSPDVSDGDPEFEPSKNYFSKKSKSSLRSKQGKESGGM